MKDKMLENLITKTVDDKLKPYGQFVCDVLEGENSQGHPSLFVEICYMNDAEKVPASVTLSLRTLLRDKLLHQGELRFPYLKYLIELPK